jgi:hypothetical protein
MKHLLFFFLILPALALAQTDTAYVVKVGDLFYLVERTTQANGSYVESSTLRGDLEQFSDYTEGAIVRRASALSQSVAEVLKADRLWTTIIQQDAGFQQAYGKSPLTDVQQQYDSTLLMDTWQLEQPGQNAVPITFSRNAQGKLRTTWNGLTAKTVYLVSSTMRVVNFNAGGAMNFYQLTPNLWTDSNRSIFIRRTAVNWTPWRPTQDNIMLFGN